MRRIPVLLAVPALLIGLGHVGLPSSVSAEEAEFASAPLLAERVTAASVVEIEQLVADELRAGRRAVNAYRTKTVGYTDGTLYLENGANVRIKKDPGFPPDEDYETDAVLVHYDPEWLVWVNGIEEIFCCVSHFPAGLPPDPTGLITVTAIAADGSRLDMADGSSYEVAAADRDEVKTWKPRGLAVIVREAEIAYMGLGRSRIVGVRPLPETP